MAEYDTVRSAGVGARAAIDEGLRAHMNKVYGLMSVAMLVTGGVAWGVGTSDALLSLFRDTTTGQMTILGWVAMFLPLVMVFAFGALINKMSAAAAQLFFYVFAAAMGQHFLGGNRSLVDGVIPEQQSSLGERLPLGDGKLPVLVALHVLHEARYIAQHFGTCFNHLRGLEARMPNADMGERAVCDNHSVAAHEAENARVELVGAAAVVAVEQDNLGPVPKRMILDMVKALKADDVLLKTLPLGKVHALLECLHRCPTVGAHGVHYFTGWEK